MIVHGWQRRFAGAAAGVVLAVALFAPAAAFADDTSNRTEADIQAQYAQLQPVYAGSQYAFSPSLASPYTAGTLAHGELVDGLNMLNYCRYLAGIPDDVSLDATLDTDAQDGAVLLAVDGVLTHKPSRPANMSPAFYDIAEGATNSSNIGQGYGHLWAFNRGCMSDSDASNIQELGHRRWILTPCMGKTGMGWAGGFSTTWAFDYSRPAGFKYDAIKWPSAGAFPAEMLGKSDPWSITVNPNVYSYTTGTAGHTITLRRVRDGKTWTFTSADTNTSGEYFKFDTQRYGNPSNCFIFRPDPSSVGGYANGDTFQVTLSGGLTYTGQDGVHTKGAAASISYTTTFVSQSDGRAVTYDTSTSIGAPRSVKCKKSLTVSGAVTPGTCTGTVLVTKQRYSGGRWVGMGSARVRVSSGRYRYTFKPSKKGKWRFSAQYGGMSGTTAYAASASRLVGVKVS